MLFTLRKKKYEKIQGKQAKKQNKKYAFFSVLLHKKRL